MKKIAIPVIVILLLSVANIGYSELPQVHIESPSGGITFESLITITGQVQSSGNIEECILVTNGIERPLALANGAFNTVVVAAPGENIVYVIARNGEGEGLDSINFFAQIPPRDIKIILSWNTDTTDVDLHVINPLGEECYYGNRTTSIGDNLDLDDTDGYGPETYVLNNAVPGNYEVIVHYYSDRGMPVTEIRVWVVLYEGTEREEKHLYEGILVERGDRITIANFTIQERIIE